MPLYEYECSKCNQVHEVMQKFSDAPLSTCPTCQGPVRKLMSMSSFSLKGTGWYTTDYKRASNSPKSGASCDKGPSDASCGTSACSSPSPAGSASS